MSHRRQKMNRQKFLPSSHCCPVYPVTHWQLKEPHSPWQRPRWPQDGKPMLTQLLSVVRQPGELDWDSAGLPRSYSWGEVIEGGWGTGHYGDHRSFPYTWNILSLSDQNAALSFFLKKTIFFFHTSYNLTLQHLKAWGHTERNRNKNRTDW